MGRHMPEQRHKNMQAVKKEFGYRDSFEKRAPEPRNSIQGRGMGWELHRCWMN